MRKSVLVKQQETQVLEEVRRQKNKRQLKKELLVIEKQTSEAKKAQKKEQKVKQIRKGMHPPGNKDKAKASSMKNRLDKLSSKRKRK